MPDHQTTHLTDRGILLISGDDAASFLQNIITGDLDDVSAGQALYSGLLTPQGKILYDFFVIPAGQAFLIEASLSEIPSLLQRLSMYRLRSDVDIADVTKTFAVEATWAGVRPPEKYAPVLYQDPRHPDLGQRAVVSQSDDTIVPPPSAECPEVIVNASTDAYHAHRIALGIPEGGKDFSFGTTFPHEALFDQLHGVSFTKGCYVGQEVVSRMHHRGTARKRIIGVEATDGAPLPVAGTEITAGPAKIGKMGSSSSSEGLALMRLDRTKEAIDAGTPIQAGDVTLDVSIPAWASFSFDKASGNDSDGSSSS